MANNVETTGYSEKDVKALKALSAKRGKQIGLACGILATLAAGVIIEKTTGKNIVTESGKAADKAKKFVTAKIAARKAAKKND